MSTRSPIPVAVHLLPTLADPQRLASGVVVVIDLLRASTTVTRALDAGAIEVAVCAEPSDAVRLRDAAGSVPCRLGGERGGVLIPGFDLGNSPGEYTPASVGGRRVIFTTTNGTRAVLKSVHAARVLIGCLNNLSAVCRLLRDDGRPVHLLCAGTGGEITLEDVLCAGLIADRVLTHAPPAARQFRLADDDQARIAAAVARSAPGGEPLLAALAQSRGGRNLQELGLGADIADCARIDVTAVVPELDNAALAFRPAQTAPHAHPEGARL